MTEKITGSKGYRKSLGKMLYTKRGQLGKKLYTRREQINNQEKKKNSVTEKITWSKGIGNPWKKML